MAGVEVPIINPPKIVDWVLVEDIANGPEDSMPCATVNPPNIWSSPWVKISFRTRRLPASREWILAAEVSNPKISKIFKYPFPTPPPAA